MASVELTRSWKDVLPADVQQRYEVIETRNAAAILQATNPDELADIVQVLRDFKLTPGMLTAKGGNKTPTAKQLDEAFRTAGWREAKYRQVTSTTLVINRWVGANERHGTERTSENRTEGHQVDNVKGRIALDVEWNAKDGNLDRDLANFRALYEAAQIDVAVMVTRITGKLRDLAVDMIKLAKAQAAADNNHDLLAKLDKQSPDPLKSTTTTNLEQLTPKVTRGDAAGCPLLVVAITERCFDATADVASDVASTVDAVDDDDDNDDAPTAIEEQS